MSEHPRGELASPAQPTPFLPNADFFISEGRVLAPTRSNLLVWDLDGTPQGALPFEGLGVEVPRAAALGGDVLVLTGEAQYSWVAVSLAERGSLGMARVPSPPPPPHSTAPHPPFVVPPKVTTDGARVAAQVGAELWVFTTSGEVVNRVVPAGVVPHMPSGWLWAHFTRGGALVLGSPELACPAQFWTSDGDRCLGVVPSSLKPQWFTEAAAAERFALVDYPDETGAMRFSVHDAGSLHPVAEGSLPHIAQSVALSPDGSILASVAPPRGGGDGTSIHLTDVTSGSTATLSDPGYSPRRVQFADEKLLLTHSPTAGLRAWDLEQRQVVADFSHPSLVRG